MRFEQTFVAVTRRLAIAIVREIEAVGSFVRGASYCDMGKRRLSMSWAEKPQPWTNLSAGSSAKQGLLTRLLLNRGNGHLLLAGTTVGRPDTRQHRLMPVLVSCPAGSANHAMAQIRAQSQG